MEAGKLVAPKVIPKDVKIIKEEEQPPDMGAGIAGGVPGGVAGGSMGGVIGGVIGGAGAAVAPPPKPKRSRAHTSWRRVQSGQAGQPRSAALSAAGAPDTHQWHGETACHYRQGPARWNSLQVVSGHPLLVQAALDAVRQWRYQPTLLNGEPVEVDTEIDVIFSLAQ